MKESGKIVKLLDGGKVEIEMMASGGCSKCGLCKIGMNDKAYMTAKSDIPVVIGDNVEVEMKEREVIFVTFLVFILPLLLFFAGYLISGYMLATLAVLLYFPLMWLYDRRSERAGTYLPYVIRKL